VPSVQVLLLLAQLWVPLLVLAHELGHATVILTVTRGPVLVLVGTGIRGPRLRFGRRFMIVFSGLGFSGGRCVHRERLTRSQQLVLSLAGPAVNIGMGAALLADALSVGHTTTGAVLLAGAIGSLEAGVLNLVPRRVGAHKSDGAIAYRALTGRDVRAVTRPHPERQLRPVFAVLLALAAVLGLVVDLPLGLGLAGALAVVVLSDRKRRR
jgi:hypothetical protein